MSNQIVATRDQTTDLDGPQFLQELVPAAEKTALLFEISYLCLAKFPELEKLIRSNAVEVQMAFNTSDTLLMQCISTSENMVNILFPMLMKAVEKEKATVAIKFLEKARQWIQDIIREVQDMVDEYGKLNRDVASATSEVNTTKVKTDAEKAKLTNELKALQDQVAHFDSLVKEKQSALDNNEKAIEAATQELQKIVSDIASRNRKFGIVAAVIPFIGAIIDAAQRSINSGDDKRRLEMARDNLNDLRGRRAELSRDEGLAQTTLMHWQFQLTKGSFDLGAVPDPVHLPEVQQNLTRIQQILLQLRSFWEKIEKLVQDLKQKTFSGEDLVDVLDDFKAEFLESIELAKEAWSKFRVGCISVRSIFALKNKDAYKFLEISPSSLTAEQWQQKYDNLKERLENFYPTPDTPALESP
uniref:putative leucine-rich repeat-containing protein DDB_G0290503 n=1 Tax=Semicossyphus pulcher TaxID=241346 RepID=UPI0037E7BBB7